MNYEVIYNKLIQHAKINNLSIDGWTYYEKHHIIPECMNGLSTTINLVNLTPKQHYVAHLLLCKIYPDNIDLIRAVILMSRIGCNSNSYNWWKKFYVKQVSMPVWQFTLQGKFIASFRSMSEAQRMTGVHKSSISSFVGLEGKNKNHAGGYLWSLTDKINNTLVKTEDYMPKQDLTAKPIDQYDFHGNFIKSFESAGQAKLAVVNGHNYSILCVCNGLQDSVHGYLWAYKGNKPKLLNRLPFDYIPIDQYDLKGNFIKTFSSIKEAAKSVHNGRANQIYSAAIGQINHCNNSLWAFKDSAVKIPNKIGNKVKIQQIDLTTNKIINEFPSIKIASLTTGVNKSSISMASRGERKTAGGYGWKAIIND